MNRKMLGVAVLLASGCVEEPSWPRAFVLRPDVCRIVELEAVLLAVQLVSADRPTRIQMSPWPGESFWTTPIEVNPVRLMLDSRLPHEDAPLELNRRVRGYFTGPLNHNPGAELFVAPATPIDGVWVFNLNKYMTFSLQPDGWRRSDLEDDDVFSGLDELQSAFEVAKHDPACARLDWVSYTRNANEERLRSGNMPTPNVPLPSSPDAGAP